MKKLFILLIMAIAVVSLAFSGGQKEAAKAKAPAQKKVTIEFMSQLPEYEARYKAVWGTFMKENPNINIKLTMLNDQDFRTQLDARLAAGTAPDIFGGSGSQQVGPTVDNYKKYLDIKDIYKYWDRLPGGKKGWLKNSKLQLGQNVNGIYGLTFEMTFWWSYIYHRDMAKDAGLGDKYSVRTVADLRNWLAKWKGYLDSKNLLTPLDLGAGSCAGWCSGQEFFQIYSDMQPGALDKLNDVYLGKGKFTDPEWKWYFKWMKEMVDKKWLPNNWWTRDWEQDMEANFIAKKVPALLHGPWMWQKVAQADPSADLTGFPVPTFTGKDRKIIVSPLVPSNYSWASPANVVDRESFKTGAFQKALNYWAGPASVKAQVENWGELTIMHFDNPLKVTSTQWKEVGAEVGKGPWSDVSFDFNTWGVSQQPHRVAGEADPILGGQFVFKQVVAVTQGKETIAQAQEAMQKQLEKAYDNLPKK